MYNQNDFVNTIELLKKVKLWGFKGYEVWHILYWPVFSHMVFSKRGDKKNTISHFFYRYKLFDFVKVKGKVIFYQSSTYDGRNDMLEAIERVSSCWEKIEVVKSVNYKYRHRRYCFRIFLLLQWFLALKKTGLKRNLIILLLEAISENYSIKCILDENIDYISSSLGLIVMNDEYSDENIFVQFFKKQHLPTATLQHGLYLKSQNKNDILYFDHIHYNFTADRFFAWGDFSKKNAIEGGVPEACIRNVGIHKYVGVDPLKPIHRQIFGILLTGGDDEWVDRTNRALIQIANEICKKYDYTYVVKNHPSFQYDRYMDYYDKDYFIVTADPKIGLLAFAQEMDFFLVGFTSTYAEMMYLNKPVFRFCLQNEFDYYEGIDFCKFSTFEEFERHYRILKNDPNLYYKLEKEYKKLCCSDGSPLLNYRKAVQELFESID